MRFRGVHAHMNAPTKAQSRQPPPESGPERRSKEAASPARHRWRFHQHCTRRQATPWPRTQNPCERARVLACNQPYNIITYTPNGPKETSDETRAHERRSAQASTHANKTTASPRRRTHKKEAIVKMPPSPPTPTHSGGGGDRDRGGRARHVRARASYKANCAHLNAGASIEHVLHTHTHANGRKDVSRARADRPMAVSDHSDWLSYGPVFVCACCLASLLLVLLNRARTRCSRLCVQQKPRAVYQNDGKFQTRPMHVSMLNIPEWCTIMSRSLCECTY